MSLLGIALELVGTTPRGLIGRRLEVHIDVAGGSSMSLHFAGVVKHLSPGPLGGTRAGIEFTGLSERERAVLGVMERLHIGW